MFCYDLVQIHIGVSRDWLQMLYVFLKKQFLEITKNIIKNTVKTICMTQNSAAIISQVMSGFHLFFSHPWQHSFLSVVREISKYPARIRPNPIIIYFLRGVAVFYVVSKLLFEFAHRYFYYVLLKKDSYLLKMKCFHVTCIEIRHMYYLDTGNMEVSESIRESLLMIISGQAVLLSIPKY